MARALEASKWQKMYEETRAKDHLGDLEEKIAMEAGNGYPDRAYTDR